MRVVIPTFVCLILLACPLFGEQGRPLTSIEVDARVATLVEEANFSGLDQYAAELWRTKARFVSGDWALFEFYSSLTRALWDHEKAEPFHEAWLEASPGSAVALTSRGRLYLAYAWSHRGGDFADDISQEKWNIFHDRLNTARGALESVKSGADPETFTALIELAALEGGDYQRYFRRALSLEPEYWPAYYVMTQFLLPRWKGRSDSCVRLADASVKARGDAEAYFRIASKAVDFEGQDLFEKRGFLWKKIKKGFAATEEKFPSSRSNLYRFLGLAVRAGDKAASRKTLERLDAMKIEEASYYDKEWGDRVRKWAGTS